MTKLTKAEQEVHIWKCADEMGYCAYITDPAELPYHLGLAKKVGARVIQHQGGTKIFYPPDSVLLQVKRKLNLSPERRAALAQRIKGVQARVTEYGDSGEPMTRPHGQGSPSNVCPA